MTTHSREPARSMPVRARLAQRIVLGALLAVGATLTGGLLLAKFQAPAETNEPPRGPSKELLKEFKDWIDKKELRWPANEIPELVLIITGEQHGYIQPCGCTRPLYGGLERRYNLMNLLRKQGIQVAAVDLGDIYYSAKLTDQGKMKYRLSMKALSLMQYDALAVGQHDFKYPLIDALGDTILNEKVSYRVLAANLLGREDNFPSGNPDQSLIGDSTVSRTSPKFGIIGTIGQSVASEIVKPFAANDANRPKFGENPKVLPVAVKNLPPEVSAKVLLYQGSFDEAKALAEAMPQFDVIVCTTLESEPPGQPTVVGGTQIIRVGHKGRYVGVLSYFKKGDKLVPHYDAMRLGEELETPEDKQASNPLVQLMENYSKEVKAKDLLRFAALAAGPHPTQTLFPNEPKGPAAYVGSEKCKDCHQADYKVWYNSKHATAYGALEEAKKPSHRQYDPECVQCHTTGFGYRTGYSDEKKTEHLKGVGCESCHGPGGLHVADPRNSKYYMSLSPWKENANDRLPKEAVERAIDLQTCQKCHDVDNDPYFKFAEYWPDVSHGKGQFKGERKKK